MHPIILPTAKGEIVGLTGLFNLSMASKEEENSELKPVKFCLKNNLALHLVPAERLGNYTTPHVVSFEASTTSETERWQ